MDIPPGIFQEHPIRAVQTVISVQQARDIMQKHGCVIEEEQGICTVTFPEGTKRQQIELTTHVENYQITLPDGYVLRQEISRYRDVTLLFYTPEASETSDTQGYASG